MIELFHVSDLHFGKSKRRNERARRLLKKIFAKWMAEPAGTKLLLVTGDITNNGNKKEYKLAAGALKDFAGRVCVVPGNHDYGFAGFGFSMNKAKSFDDPFAASLGIRHPFRLKRPYEETIDDGEGHKLLLIGLNSCSMTPNIFDIARGEIGPRQTKALDEALARPRGPAVPAVVALHHIPHRRADEFWMSLNDYKGLMKVLRRRVKAVAFGHEGKMSEPEYRNAGVKPIPPREMKGTRGRHIKFLDANHSVEDQAYYYVKVDDAGLATSVVKL